MPQKKQVVAVVQHVPFEGPGHIADWARQRGHELRVCRVFGNDPLPAVGETDMLVLMGGPMNSDEEERFPWLRDEKHFLKAAIAEKKIVVGICLGAQLLADALGSRVFAHTQREIGWFPVQAVGECQKNILAESPGEEFPAFHWHGDTFDLPPGAVHLARSSACEQQAFLFDGRLLGLQFHLEATPQSIGDLLAHCSADIIPGLFVQDAARINAGLRNCAALNGRMEKVFDRLMPNARLPECADG